ncbi:hypothetical protein BDF20DRAFT_857605 [Mycotypha africana]|uniref:uncharacterized protein n=1 Tax=Mycotypha africana TaxID=64632 RepID=UPI002301AF4B|nr:uncharacterized protein BDF20DRAFT_857605 [Mycotypha africana]KAI8984024.1 hypothetical protein BDF20DRAFT_857605 [Mycotypha africana]
MSKNTGQAQSSSPKTMSEWIDKQGELPYSIWGLSAASLATLPLSVKKYPGIPSLIQTIAFPAIFAGAGYVTNAGDSDNGAGIATAWCLSWSFLNAKNAWQSKRPIPLTLLGFVAYNTFVYGKKTLIVNGYI